MADGWDRLVALAGDWRAARERRIERDAKAAAFQKAKEEADREALLRRAADARERAARLREEARGK